MALAWEKYWLEQGFQVVRVSRAGTHCLFWSVRDAGKRIWPNEWFRASAPGGVKKIRPEFLNNSEVNRLELLAGLLDSDGTRTMGGFDFVSKWPGLAKEVFELARGLGFKVSRNTRKHSIKSLGFSGEYYHVRIMGEVSRIPCREKPARKSARGATGGNPTYGFSVKSVGPGPYAGFTLDGNHRFLLESGIVTHNSYSGGVWMFLDWLRDSEYTSVNVVGPSENHLKDNLFTHLVTLHNNASLPLPGLIGDLFIGLDPKSRKGAITGIVIPLGKRPSGRLQGRKRVPRRHPHPTLGKLSRIRFMLDEVEKIPIGVWKDVDNIFANLDTDVDGFKIVCAFNPEDAAGPVAQRCEPEKGWENFDKENDEEWISKRGWKVLRLDAAKCENVVQSRVLYPGLQTKEGYDRIIQNAGGVDSSGAQTMARGCFPSQGAIYSVIPASLVLRMRAEFMFAEEPLNVGAADLALEGRDTAEFAAGRFGRAVGIKYQPTFDNPNGREVMFKDKAGARRFRWALQVDQIFSLPKGDTVKMAEAVRDAAVKLKIKPGNLMLDRTGNGAGVHDFLKSLWSEEVRGVNYQQSATERKILEEDTETAKDQYVRAVSELWFALKAWAEFDFLKIAPKALSEELALELGGRRYTTGKNNKVEGKDDYASRGNKSPNKADALTLLLHGVRIATGCIPSSKDDLAGITGSLSREADDAVPVFESRGEAFDYLDNYL